MKTGTLSGGPVAWRTLPGAQPIGEPTKALQIRNVLVPVDFSVASLEAIEFALPLVKRFGADLHMVHVFEPYHSLASTAAVTIACS